MMNALASKGLTNVSCVALVFSAEIGPLEQALAPEALRVIAAAIAIAITACVAFFIFLSVRFRICFVSECCKKYLVFKQRNYG
jgi:hypothetical protein